VVGQDCQLTAVDHLSIGATDTGSLTVGGTVECVTGQIGGTGQTYADATLQGSVAQWTMAGDLTAHTNAGFFGGDVQLTVQQGATLENANAWVASADLIAVRDHPRGPGNRAGIADPYDITRDRLVNAADMLAVRNAATSPFSALRLIDLTAAPTDSRAVIAMARYSGVHGYVCSVSISHTLTGPGPPVDREDDRKRAC